MISRNAAIANGMKKSAWIPVLLLMFSQASHGAGSNVNRSAAENTDTLHKIIRFISDWRFLKSETADALSYPILKPWLLPAANAFFKESEHIRPDGAVPGEDLAIVQPAFDGAGW